MSRTSDVFPKTVVLNKRYSETPLECIKRFVESHPKYNGLKLSYAGRLDPMAKGKLLVLVGDENKKRKDYENLKKDYSFSVIFGVKTDSYDILGISSIIYPSTLNKIQEKKLEKIISGMRGRKKMSYPIYSSKPVFGKPLFYYAKNNLINNIKIPSKYIYVYDLKIKKHRTVTSFKLLATIKKRIGLLKGDFRQSEILSVWDKNLSRQKIRFSVLDLEISCSSGTYVRAIADKIGDKIGCGGIALDINRTRIYK